MVYVVLITQENIALIYSHIFFSIMINVVVSRNTKNILVFGLYSCLFFFHLPFCKGFELIKFFGNILFLLLQTFSCYNGTFQRLAKKRPNFIEKADFYKMPKATFTV